MEAAWTQLRSSHTDFELLLLAQGLPLLGFWFLSGVFFLIDWTRPRWAVACKCQPDAPVDFALMRKVAWTVFTHQLTVYPLTSLALYPLIRHRFSYSEELPSVATVLCILPLLALFTEIEFYYIHRLLHHPRLYPQVHKRHHEVKAPFAVCALYFHPIESMTPFIEATLPCALLGTHVLVYAAWSTLATCMVVLHHSGYELPWFPDTIPFSGFDTMSLQHDDHHKHFNVCFGVLGLLDWVHGTAKLPKRNENEKKAC